MTTNETTSQHDVTNLLLLWNEQGSQEALDKLMPLVEDELRRIARRFFCKERPNHTLQPTELINECYMVLVGRRQVTWTCRAHFFGFAAQTMRRILVDYARKRGTVRHGGHAHHVPLVDVELAAPNRFFELLLLDEALNALARMSKRQARIVELRFFGGHTEQETAEFLGISRNTVRRDWLSAQAWLLVQLTNPPTRAPSNRHIGQGEAPPTAP